MKHAASAPANPVRGRITWVDVTKGVAMFLVFFGHLGVQWFPALDRTLDAIYTFHMPLFFVTSGFFFHARYGFGQLAAKRARMLLVPYYVFSVLALAKPVAQLVSPSLYKEGGNGLEGVVSSILTIVFAQGNSGLWFLWAVFTGQLALWAVVRLVRNRIPVLLVLMVAFVIADFILQLMPWSQMLPFQLGKIFESVSYMGFGYVIGQTQNLRVWQEGDTKGRRAVLMVIAAALFVAFYGVQTTVEAEGVFLPLLWLIKFCTTITAIVTVVLLCTLVPQWGWLQTVGRDSLVFYGVNDFMLKIVKFAVFSIGGVEATHWPLIAQFAGGCTVVAAAMLLAAAVDWMVQRHARWMIGAFPHSRT